MQWEIMLLLIIGMPFALYYWTVSGVRRLAKSVVAGRPSLERKLR